MRGVLVRACYALPMTKTTPDLVDQKLATLRDEVTEELHGLPYEEIMPGDRERLDQIIAERAADRA